MTARAPTPVVQTPDVPTLLAALGGTADEVAASLRAAGIRGRRRKPARCPLAAYLVAHDVVDVEVFHVVRWWQDNGRRETTTPAPCFVFLCSFDGGAYPDLVEVSP